jgi:hypothetical protein
MGSFLAEIGLLMACLLSVFELTAILICLVIPDYAKLR